MFVSRWDEAAVDFHVHVQWPGERGPPPRQEASGEGSLCVWFPHLQHGEKVTVTPRGVGAEARVWHITHA